MPSMFSITAMAVAVSSTTCVSALPHLTGGKVALFDFHRGSDGAVTTSSSSPPTSTEEKIAPPLPLTSTTSTISVTLTNGTVISSGCLYQNFALAAPSWANHEYTSYALWGAGTYGSYAWGSAPYYIASYSCQSPYITEKLLSLGSDVERNVVLWWLLTTPMSPVGKVWEAGNAEWHVGSQGTWESSGEFVAMVGVYTAFADASTVMNKSSERLVCASTSSFTQPPPPTNEFTLVTSVDQPFLNDTICGTLPASLITTPEEAITDPSHPFLFVDYPSTTFGGPSRTVENSGRILTQAIRLTTAGTTYLSVPLAPRNTKVTWASNITVIDVSSGVVVGSTSIPISGTEKEWTVIPVSSSSSSSSSSGGLPAGVYLLVLVLEDEQGGGGNASSKDSFFYSMGWVSNGRPGSSGGSSSTTYGESTHWTRNPSASPSDPRLVQSYTRTIADAVSVEVNRVKDLAAQGRPSPSLGGLGRTLAETTSLALSWALALTSQTPTTNSGGYDIYVIPDPLFRGSLANDVDSGCSYYDLLHIGFASSYINMRVLEGVLAYKDMQNANLVPSTCSSGTSGSSTDAFGSDNANALTDPSVIPCYTSQEIDSIIATLRVAIGDRFSDAATGKWVDWFGCDALGSNGGNVTACGIADVHNGSAAQAAPLLNVVATDFVPTIALAAKLGVPAGGVNYNMTKQELARVISVSHSAPANKNGPGWYPNALLPLEDVTPNGAKTTIAASQWQLVDAQGFAVRSENETGDWHMFAPQSIVSGGANGYGQYTAQAENGGRFFTTTAMVWEGINSPVWASSPLQPPYNTSFYLLGPYPEIAYDFTRLVTSLTSIANQLESGDTSQPLVPNDRSFLATSVSDQLVLDLCVKVRQEFHFPNNTDNWHQRLCEYYQDVCWGTPESGAVLYAFAKGLVGAHVGSGGWLYLLGSKSPSAWNSSTPSWTVPSIPVPSGWPVQVQTLQVNGLAVNGVGLTVSCDIATGSSPTLSCVASVI